MLVKQQTSFFSLLQRNKAFRKIWLAQVISELGDWFNMVALMQLLQRYTPSTQEAMGPALLLILQALPMILWSPIAGMVADRFSRKHIMIAADLLRMLVVLGYLFVQSSQMAWLIYVLISIHFSIAAFFEPARSATMALLIPPKDLEAANALSGATWSMMLALGAALGGFVSSKSLTFAFVIDACSFLGSASLLWSLSIPKITSKENLEIQPHSSVLSESKGFAPMLALLKEKPRLVSILLIKACIALTGGAAWYLGTIYGQHIFTLGKEGSISLGILYASSGLGSVLGTLLIHRFSSTKKLIILCNYIGRIPVFLLFVFSSHLWLAAIALVIQSISGSFLWVASTTLLQKNVPNSLQGRFFSIDMAGHTIGFILSTLLPAYFLSTLLSKTGNSWHFAATSISVGVAILATIVAIFWAFLLYGSAAWKHSQETTHS